MKNDKTTKFLLAVIVLALVGNLVRPLLDMKPVQAQTNTPDLPSKTFEAKYDTPYVVVNEGIISVWYLHQTNPKASSMEEVIKGTKLIQADAEVLSH